MEFKPKDLYVSVSLNNRGQLKTALLMEEITLTVLFKQMYNVKRNIANLKASLEEYPEQMELFK